MNVWPFVPPVCDATIYNLMRILICLQSNDEDDVIFYITALIRKCLLEIVFKEHKYQKYDAFRRLLFDVVDSLFILFESTRSSSPSSLFAFTSVHTVQRAVVSMELPLFSGEINDRRHQNGA